MKPYILIFLWLISGAVYAQQTHDEPVDLCTRSDSAMVAYLSGKGIATTYGNKVKLLKTGEEKFTDLFEAIKQAKHHIHLEYFNFRNDSIAGALFELLATKAKEGVKVRTVFDSFGNWSNSRPLKKKHLRKIREKGIEIFHFDPLKFPYINHVFHRDHRKIAVIDGKVAYTGGMNIADYYIKGLPEIGNWRDMHIRIEGDAVKGLQDIFVEMWNKTAGQHIGGEEYYPKAESTDKPEKEIAIVDRIPRKLPKQMRQVYAEAIRSANHHIEIVNPYFVPVRSIKKALREALKRGVKVDIMLSTKADILFTPDGSLFVGHRLMKHGANVYLFNNGFQHAKTMTVDSLFCTIGSTNLNSRSLRYDYEVNAFIFDKETTAELNKIFEEDKTHSTLLTPEVWKEVSYWKRFKGWFANVLTLFL